MGIFTATFSAIAASAAQDVFEIVAPSTSRVVLREVRLGQYSDAGDAEAELLSVLFIRGNTVSGSGGASVTPVHVSGHSSAPSPTATVERNNTTVASGGSPATVLADAWNTQAPYLWLPPEKDQRFVIEKEQRFVIRITAPADAVTLNGTLVFEETGVPPL